ncbi:MAG: diguanylate cyclase [Cyanobacteria bacterium]|nr:diguanylate cyclase [Cyanobacteriota bacterium]
MSNLSDQFSPLDTTVKGCFLIIKEGSRVKVESLQQKTYSIGRNTSANINLTSKGISRHHATTYYAKGKYWILDGDPEGNLSTNGLTIKGQRKQLHQLSSGDVIAFCDNVFAMFLDKEDIRIGDKKEVCLLADTIGFLGIDDWLGVNTETVIEDRDLGFQQPKTDDLTKLPNRSTFLDRVRQSILFKETVNNNHKFAVLFIDLDRFKLVNDSLGHFAGDLLLIHVSEAMHSCLRSRDMLARLGGDEFAILIDYIHDYDESVQIARRLQENLEKSLWIQGYFILN